MHVAAGPPARRSVALGGLLFLVVSVAHATATAGRASLRRSSLAEAGVKWFAPDDAPHDAVAPAVEQKKEDPMGDLDAISRGDPKALAEAHEQRNSQSKGVPADQLVQIPLRHEGPLVVGALDVDGSQFTVVYDTGSSNTFLPSVDCAACGSHMRLPRGAATLDPKPRSIRFASGGVMGSGQRGKACLGSASTGTMCVSMEILATREETAAITGLPFDGIVGLALPQLAFTAGYSFVGRMVAQPSWSFPEPTDDDDLTWPAKLSLASMPAPEPRAANPTFAFDLGAPQPTLFLGGFPAERAPNFAWIPVRSSFGDWSVRLDRIEIGGQPLAACSSGRCSAVLDTGCSGLAGPGTQIRALHRMALQQQAQVGAPQASPCAGIPSVVFVIAGRRFTLPSSTFTKDVGSKCHLSWAALPQSSSEANPSLILGHPFLKTVLAVFDPKQQRMGLSSLP